MYTRLVEHFSVLEDSRCAGKVLHHLIDILVIIVPELLDSLMLKDSIVTIDAMGCQRAITEKIIAQG